MYQKKRESENTYSGSGAENVLEKTRHEIIKYHEIRN